jgi:hypothetical protein
LRKSYFGNAFISGIIYVAATFYPALADNEAGDTKDPVCGKWITETLHTLDELERFIPLVPPDEENYLSSEFAGAASAGSLPRIGAVMRRSLYYAWNLHTEFFFARQKLKNAPSPITGAKFRIKLASTIPYPVARAAQAWNEYVEADKTGILTPEQAESGSSKMEKAMAAPGEYIWCLAEQIDDRN